LRRSVEVAMVADQLQPDHVHAHFVDDCSVAVALANTLRPGPWSATAHARDIFRSPPSRTVLIARSASWIVTVCQYNRDQLVARGVPNDKVVVIPCGVDVDRIVPGARPPETLQLRVIAVGRLVAKKGFSVLVDAMALLRSWGIECECSIVGDGPLGQELSSQIEARGLSGCVMLLGARGRDEVLEQLAAADVFCLPCVVDGEGDRDSMPVAAKEAMACGLPIVATHEVGLPELVAPGAGLLVPPGDAVALADALREMVAIGSVGRADMGSEARACVERFSLRHTTAAMFDLLVLGETTQRWAA